MHHGMVCGCKHQPALPWQQLLMTACLGFCSSSLPPSQPLPIECNPTHPSQQS